MEDATMKAKKVLVSLLTAGMVLGAAMPAYAKDETTHIYVMTSTEDHGWTGSVATFAKEKVEELNGKCKISILNNCLNVWELHFR